MTVPVFDFWTIFLATLVDVIVDIIVFKLFKVKGLTVIITLILNFFIPYISFNVFLLSKPPIDQQITALGDFITNMMVNLVNYTISAVFGYIITAVIYVITLGHTERPELDL